MPPEDHLGGILYCGLICHGSHIHGNAQYPLTSLAPTTIAPAKITRAPTKAMAAKLPTILVEVVSDIM